MSERLTKSWETSAFDREKGEWTSTVNHAYEHGEEDIESLLVRPASGHVIKPLRRTTRKSTSETSTLVAGDAQFPFSDPEATGTFLQYARDLQPDEIVLLGDMTDFPALSKYPQRKEWVDSTQKGIDEYYTFLSNLRANAPNSRIIAIHGNHEQRLINSLERNLAEIAGIRLALGNRALLSVQNLARYDELGVESVDGYPNGIYWASDKLKFTHGTYTKTGGSNAARYLATEDESTVYGHTHRMELAYRTKATRLGSRIIAAASPGALCRIDGTVPGVHYTPTADGEIVKRAENWQQGHLVILRTGDKHEISPRLYE